jgi:hypothetical protein
MAIWEWVVLVIVAILGIGLLVVGKDLRRKRYVLVGGLVLLADILFYVLHM